MKDEQFKRTHFDLNNLPTDRGSIEEMLAMVSAEIDDITHQLTEFDGDDEEFQEWEKKADYARKIRLLVKHKLTIKLNGFLSQEKRERAAANAEANREAARIKAEAKKEASLRDAEIRKAAMEAKAERIRSAQWRDLRDFGACKDWLRKHHPQVYDAMVSECFRGD